MRKINHHSTLYYYDGPQVFEARDSIGGHYVGVMIEPDGESDRYLICGVDPSQLREFREGNVDLRELLLQSSVEEWFLSVDEHSLSQPLDLHTGSGEIPEEYLPEAGFYLTVLEDDSTVLAEARERQNMILELSVSPPEATEEHRIHASTLGGLLHHFQILVKHSYTSAKKDLTLKARRSLDSGNAHVLDVYVPAKAGSFRICLTASKSADMIGQTEVARAMAKLDLLFENPDDIKRTMETVKSYKGHLAGSYVRFLEFLDKHETGLEYFWADSSSDHSVHRQIKRSQIRPLLTQFSGFSNLGSESISIVGKLKNACSDKGTWRLKTSEGEFRGKTQKDPKFLEGLQIGSRYQFDCIEVIEEIAATGRELRRLYLEEYQPA